MATTFMLMNQVIHFVWIALPGDFNIIAFLYSSSTPTLPPLLFMSPRGTGVWAGGERGLCVLLSGPASVDDPGLSQ